jgi:hypothetical protein
MSILQLDQLPDNICYRTFSYYLLGRIQRNILDKNVSESSIEESVQQAIKFSECSVDVDLALGAGNHLHSNTNETFVNLVKETTSNS